MQIAGILALGGRLCIAFLLLSDAQVEAVGNSFQAYGAQYPRNGRKLQQDDSFSPFDTTSKLSGYSGVPNGRHLRAYGDTSEVIKPL
jgi:hypothetical protein